MKAGRSALVAAVCAALSTACAASMGPAADAGSSPTPRRRPTAAAQASAPDGSAAESDRDLPRHEPPPSHAPEEAHEEAYERLDAAPPVVKTDAEVTERASRGSLAAPRQHKRHAATASPSGSAAPASTPPTQAPALRAGRHDDNKQYNRFLEFLRQNAGLIPHAVDVSERLVLRTVDTDGKSLPNCAVEVQDLQGAVLATATTLADGRTQFFPAHVSSSAQRDFVVKARCGRQTRRGQLSREGRREIEMHFGHARSLPEIMPVDIAIVLDTTGSMQSQINRLKSTLKAIHFQLSQTGMRVDIRFALVAYRDRGDAYLTQVSQFTSQVEHFQIILDKIDADGGGDTPEDLQAALREALATLSWRADGLRLGFVIADAPPHTDYEQEFTYATAMHRSLERGIKWTTIGAGGLDRAGEIVFRQIAQFTMGEYVFLTQGGGGDSDGGVGEASHHVGSNYRTENLDQAIVRIVRREISYLTDKPRDFDDTIIATARPGVPHAQVLPALVSEAFRQLLDYATMRLVPGTPVAVVPVVTSNPKLLGIAEALSEQLLLIASRQGSLKIVERDLEALSQEVKLQLSDLFDVEKAVPIGKMVGAEMLIVAKLVASGGGGELFARLVRVETGEILSVAKVNMDATILSSR